MVTCPTSLLKEVGRSATTAARICDPEYQARLKAHRHTPEYRDYNREYNKAYAKTPEGGAIRKASSKAYKQGIQARLRKCLRSRLHAALNGRQKTGSAVKDLGCSIIELKEHLESQFKPGMTWSNHAFNGWHIDHRAPLVLFDLTDREQFLRACHYTNLQPLWAKENMSKGGRA